MIRSDRNEVEQAQVTLCGKNIAAERRPQLLLDLAYLSINFGRSDFPLRARMIVTRIRGKTVLTIP